MPGANERALEKARTIAADALILDLEDSVAPEAKAEARAKTAAAVSSRSYGRREVVIRINGLDTPWGVDDLKMAAAAGPDAVLVPKVARPGDIVNVSRIHGAMGGAETTRMWAMMETPMAIFNVREIASVHQVARPEGEPGPRHRRPLRHPALAVDDAARRPCLWSRCDRWRLQ
jgi:citrate lyase subunit beta/citryl-CoA lyase